MIKHAVIEIQVTYYKKYIVIRINSWMFKRCVNVYVSNFEYSVFRNFLRLLLFLEYLNLKVSRRACRCINHGVTLLKIYILYIIDHSCRVFRIVHAYDQHCDMIIYSTDIVST